MSTLKRLSLLSPLLSQIEEAMPQPSSPIDTASNKASLILAYKAWVTSTSDLLYNYGKTDDSVIIRLTRLVNDVICKLEPSLVLECCKLCYDTLLDFLSNKISLTYSDFKDLITATTHNESISEALVAPINTSLSRVLSRVLEYKAGIWSSTNMDDIQLVQSYFGFLIKLPLSNVKLEEDALQDYVDLESNYKPLDLTNPYLPCLRNIITEWFKTFRYDGKRCRHGKGAVADAKSFPLDKYRNMNLDMRLEYLYKRNSFIGIHEYLPIPAKYNLDRCSRLVFVPKNVSKLRTISMEPASLQYVQQGVMLEMYDFFKCHKHLKKHVRLSDQTVNQSLAYDGSITNKYATTDLSHASDSVLYKLVKYLFSKTPEVYRWLVGTRSDYTLLPNGVRIKLKKFAPMGSALCFPIETAIFAAIAELAVTLCHEQGINCDCTTGIYNDHYSVYGDDIIIPLQVYDTVCKILVSLGFSVNESKSYCDSPFKESCGGNYYCGRDITPLKWKVILADDGSVTPKAYMSICSTINMCSDRKLKSTRALLLHLLRDNGINPLFSTSVVKSPMIFSTHCTNFHLKRVRCYSQNVNKPNYQKEQFVYTAVQSVALPVKPEDRQDIDDILYFHKLRKEFKTDISYMTNNMSYDTHTRSLTTDVSQSFNKLSVIEKQLKFSRGEVDV